MANSIWVGGVELTEIASGDVSAIEEQIVEVKNSSTGRFIYAGNGVGGGARFWVGPTTDVLIRNSL